MRQSGAADNVTAQTELGLRVLFPDTHVCVPYSKESHLLYPVFLTAMVVFKLPSKTVVKSVRMCSLPTTDFNGSCPK